MSFGRRIGAVMLALIACSAGCREAAVPGQTPATPQRPAGEGSEPTAGSLREVITRMSSLRGCKDECCTGTLPVGYKRAWVGGADATHAVALRRIVDDSTPPDVHALAVLWLSRAMDVDDLPRFAKCVDSSEPAGRFPSVNVGQMMRQCESVSWEDKTLGRACLDAAGAVVARDFPDAASFHSWYRANLNPGRSFDYWQKVLTQSLPPPEELQEKLRTSDPEMYFRVVSLNPDILRARDDGFVRTAKETIGTSRLLRLLRREESFREMASDESFGVFAVTVLSRAEAIFQPGDCRSLVQLWEGPVFAKLDHARAVSAVAASRCDATRRSEILHRTLESITWSQHVVLTEIGRRRPAEDRELLRTWYHRKDASDSIREGILQGLAEAGAVGRSALAAIASGGGPRPEEQALVDAFMSAARGVGYQAPPECEKSLRTRALKGMSKEAYEEADREAAPRRARCVQGAVTWLK